MPKGWIRSVAVSVGMTLLVMGITVGPADAAQPTRAQVLSAYAPYVYFHPNESFFPTDASAFVAKSELTWSHGGGCRDSKKAGAGKIDAFKLGHGGYTNRAVITSFPFCNAIGADRTSADLTRPWDSRNSLGNQPEGYFLQFPNSGHPGNLKTAPVYYEYHAKQSVTYWFFYAYNDAPGGGLFNHEGDWERISIQLGANNRAQTVAFFEHEGHCIVPWSDVSKLHGHPQVYSAIGTHATYPRPGDWPLPAFQKDHAAANGAVWKTYLREANVLTAAWYGFGGAWGEVGNNPTGDSTGPLGPSRYKLGAPDSFTGSRCDLTP